MDVLPEITQSEDINALGDIPAVRFGGFASWTLRLVVTDTSGREREFRYLLNLG